MNERRVGLWLWLKGKTEILDMVSSRVEVSG